jgi:hypothetical protein
MYTIVTGAAGFIGSNLVKALNERGVRKIIAVDNLTGPTSSATSSIATSPITSTSRSSSTACWPATSTATSMPFCTRAHVPIPWRATAAT